MLEEFFISSVPESQQAPGAVVEMQSCLEAEKCMRQWLLKWRDSVKLDPFHTQLFVTYQVPGMA